MKRQIWVLMLSMLLPMTGTHAADFFNNCTTSPDGKKTCTSAALMKVTTGNNNCVMGSGDSLCRTKVDQPAVTNNTTITPATTASSEKNCITSDGKTVCGNRTHVHHADKVVILADSNDNCIVNGATVHCPDKQAPILMISGCYIDYAGRSQCALGDKISINRFGVVGVNTVRPICVTNFNGQTYCTANANPEIARPDQINCDIGISNRIYCYRVEPVTGLVCITDNSTTSCYDPNQLGTQCQKIEQTIACSGPVVKTYIGIEP